MNAVAAVKQLWSIPDLLSIEWADGTVSDFASLWLRDNLREDRDPHSGQRFIDIADLPENPRIRSAAAHDGAVHVEWEAESRPATFELEWLLAHASNRIRGRPERTPRRSFTATRCSSKTSRRMSSTTPLNMVRNRR